MDPFRVKSANDVDDEEEKEEEGGASFVRRVAPN